MGAEFQRATASKHVSRMFLRDTARASSMHQMTMVLHRVSGGFLSGPNGQRLARSDRIFIFRFVLFLAGVSTCSHGTHSGPLAPATIGESTPSTQLNRRAIQRSSLTSRVKDLRIAGNPSGMVKAFWYRLDIIAAFCFWHSSSPPILARATNYVSRLPLERRHTPQRTVSAQESC